MPELARVQLRFLGWRALLAAAALALLGACWQASDTVAARFPVAIAPLIERNEKLAPTDEAGEGRFGVSLALSADGTTALVGAPGDHGLVGSVFVFTRSGSTWTQQGPKLSIDEAAPSEEPQCLLEPGECGLGGSVALSANGDTALIGAPRENGRGGAAWVFRRSGSTWSRSEQLTAGAEEQGEGRFGRSVALSPDGSTALIGAPRDNAGRGAAWVFARSGTSFVHQGPKLVGGEESGEGFFGRSLALSVDGSLALIGSPGDSGHVGAAWAFARAGTSWSQLGGKLTGGEEGGAGRFGFSLALSAAGDTALVGGRSDEGGVGAAWVFARTGSLWAQQGAKITAGGEAGLGEFGSSAALSADGNSALIGAPRDASPLGAAWVFKRSGGTWTQEGAKLAAAQAGTKGSFGASVAIAANDGAALIGAPRDSANVGTVWSFSGTPIPPPVVSAVSPGSGPIAGGTPVTITGSGFLAGAGVQIGSAATSVDVVSDTEITAITAPSSAGASQVTVTDLYGASSSGPSFTYLGPPAVPQPTGTVPQPTGTTPLTGVPAPGGGVLSSFTLSLPPPKLAVTGNLTPVSGVVRVKLPGSRRFVPLTTGLQVPFGTIVDATLGTVTVTTARPDGGTQTATFYTGEFLLTQARNGVVLATLLGGSYASCPTARQRAHRARVGSAGAARSHRVRKLWAEGHGKYSTKGNYATGAALGTRWLTEDLCEGTIITVLIHRVTVTNLVTHRRVVVKAGHSYLAKAP
ncbi:MAG TPA: IPT/TIG domain-containing protein [Solirubrobacteraceae bacterium]